MPNVALTFPDRNRLGELQMVGGQYDCAGLDTPEGPSGRTIGPGKHPLRDFRNIEYTDADLNRGEVLITSNATHIWRAYVLLLLLVSVFGGEYVT